MDTSRKIGKRLVSCFLSAALLLWCLPVAEAVETVDYSWGEAQALPGQVELQLSGEETSESYSFFAPASSRASREGDFSRQLNGRQQYFYNMLASVSVDDVCRAPANGGFRQIKSPLPSAYSFRVTGSASSSGRFVPSGESAAQINALYTDMLGALDAFRYDAPEAFWASRMQYGYTVQRESNTASYRVTAVYYGFYLYYGGQESSMYGTMMSRARSLAAEIAPLPDTYSRVKAVHDILADTNTYASGSTKDDKLSHWAYSALIPNDSYEPVCDGYSKAFKIICDLLGIPCVLVISETHMWNMVQMDDGIWYYVDVTWDDEARGKNWAYFLIGSQTRVGGEIFSQEKSHRVICPYQKQPGYGNVNLRYPNVSKGEYVYLGTDYPSTTFPDVGRGDWYYEAVEEAYNLGLISGDSNGYFHPAKSITRAEFAQVMANSFGADLSRDRVNHFADVPRNAWYRPAVTWAAEMGIMNGYQDRFRPGEPISREEMCMVFYQLFSPGAGSFSPWPPFEDAGKVSSWAREAVAYCASLGLIKGDDNGNVNPKNETRRREAAVLFVRYAQLL